MGQSAVESAVLDSHQPAASEGGVKPRDVPRGHTSALVLGHTSLVGAARPPNCSWLQVPQVNYVLGLKTSIFIILK